MIAAHSKLGRMLWKVARLKTTTTGQAKTYYTNLVRRLAVARPQEAAQVLEAMRAFLKNPLGGAP